MRSILKVVEIPKKIWILIWKSIYKQRWVLELKISIALIQKSNLTCQQELRSLMNKSRRKILANFNNQLVPKYWIRSRILQVKKKSNQNSSQINIGHLQEIALLMKKTLLSNDLLKKWLKVKLRKILSLVHLLVTKSRKTGWNSNF